MKVSEYRDLANHAFSMARDLSACVTDGERANWARRAETLRWELWQLDGTCKRASADDKATMQRAKEALNAAFDKVSHLILPEMKFFGV